MPQSLKTFIGGVYGSLPLKVRFGKHYGVHNKLLMEYEQWNEEKKIDFIYNKTLETLLFAENNIPFYQKTFLEFGVSSVDFKELSDIKLFPCIDKSDIKNHLKDLYTDKHSKPIEYFTGGSTSQPTKFYLPFASSRGKEKVYVNHMFSQLGYKYRDRTVLLKGRETATVNKNKYWDYEPVDNYLCVSSNYLQSEYINEILQEVKKFNASYFFGYTSAICDFIKTCINNGVDNLPGIKGVLIVSEVLYKEQLALIRDFFNCDVMLQYGHSERCSFAYNINKSDYKFYTSYGLTRNIESELVVTSFDNFVMPFINFKTNDYMVGNFKYVDNASDVVSQVSDIEGRIQEYLVTKDGRLISIVTMGAGHFSNLLNVDAIQYQQKVAGEVTLLVQPKADTVVDANALRLEMSKHTKDGIKFAIHIVSVIEKSSRGKRVLCKQMIDLSKYS